MTWLLWRQHRNQAAIAAGALAAFVVVVALTGVRMAGDYHQALHSCAATGSCGSVGDSLFSGDGAIIDLVNLTVVVPVLIGLFWGAPLVAREIEEGTHNFVWTQSITRRRWIAAKTATLLGAATLVGVALTIAVTWWYRTFDLIHHNRFDPGHFDIQGIVPVGYALFGAALGLATGAILRRTLPALATTLAVIVALRVVVTNYVRPHFMAPVNKLVSLATAGSGTNGSAWVLHSHLVDPSGHNVPNRGLELTAMPSACRQQLAATRDRLALCLDAHGYRTKIVVQPASRYWTFQGIETALFVVLALGLVAATFVLVNRDA